MYAGRLAKFVTEQLNRMPTAITMAELEFFARAYKGVSIRPDVDGDLRLMLEGEAPKAQLDAL